MLLDGGDRNNDDRIFLDRPLKFGSPKGFPQNFFHILPRFVDGSIFKI
jgi:hypothetical protein